MFEYLNCTARLNKADSKFCPPFLLKVTKLLIYKNKMCDDGCVDSPH